MWILAALSTVAVVGLAAAKYSSPAIETPEYEVLERLGDVEIRRYDRMVVARTSVGNSSFESSGSQGFRTVASYIFGGNERNQKIAMTAPVVMKMGDSASLYFVMPKQFSREDLPVPSSGAVELAEMEPQVLAVLRFGGFSNDARIREYCDRLAQTLLGRGIKTQSDFMYMGYNAPWDVINRRNEVAVAVEFTR